MSLFLLLAATVSPTSTSSATAQNTAAQRPVAQRTKARVAATASATIIRLEKVSPLSAKTAPTSKVQRPIAKQRSVKSGVPYVEFY